MNEFALRTHGFAVEGITVPPFVLRWGEIVCLHVTRTLDYKQESRAMARFSDGAGFVETSSVVVPARVPAYGRWQSFMYRRETCADYLAKASGVRREDASLQLKRLGVDPSWRVVSIAQGPRLILGLLAAWSKADIVVFADGGLDPDSRGKVFSAVGDWVSDNKAAIVLHSPIYRGIAAACSEEGHSIGSLGRCVMASESRVGG